MKYRVILLFVSLFLLSNCDKDKVENNCNIEHISDAYDYPVKPGTPEWAEFSTGQEMADACQIPNDILNNMSTEGLIETVLNYPLFGDMYLSNINDQTGFNGMHESFNGLRELLQRQDAAAKLFERYELMHPVCKENNWPSLVKPGESRSFSFSFVEIIIAQYVILNQFDEFETVFQEIITKNKQKNEYDIGKEHSVLILGRIMYLCEYSPFMEEYNSNHYVKIFIDGASDFKIGTLDIVNKYANKFLNQK